MVGRQRVTASQRLYSLVVLEFWSIFQLWTQTVLIMIGIKIRSGFRVVELSEGFQGHRTSHFYMNKLYNTIVGRVRKSSQKGGQTTPILTSRLVFLPLTVP
jgi:hypothetical protein